jgi:hypothetical protein
VATLGLRDRDSIALDLIGVAGLTATALGLTLLAPSKRIGFDAGAAIAGVVGQLPTTLPAAVLVLSVALAELGAGLVLARAIRRGPFDSIADALLAAGVATVLKDVAALSILGQVGAFRQPILAVIDVALLVVGWRIRPLIATTWRPSLAAIGSIPLALLIGVVWAGPILVQLASPVVPFIDVLPNHVAPAEHLRAFGSFTPLTSTQSPIYGPSRTLLGYTAVVGTVTAISGLQATLAAASFVLPTTLLVAVAAYRLAVVVAGPAAGSWGLLAFALTGSFARLSDDRATVVVLPLVAWALATTIRSTAPVAKNGEPPWRSWRLPEGVVVGVALGAAILVHPIVGALAVATIGLAGAVHQGRIADLAVPATATAAVLALPQAATMLGIALPAVVLVVAIAAAVLAGIAIDRDSSFHGALIRGAGIAVVIGAGLGLLALRPSIGDLVVSPAPFVEGTALLLLLAIAGALAGVPAARNPVVLAGLAVGFAVAVGTQAVPRGAGMLAQALRFELPKTLYYWIPVVAAVAAAGTLSWLWRTDRMAWAGRVGIVGLWLVIAAVPLRFEPIDALHLGEHRFSEALAIDLRVAARGFWVGYPDSREIVDAPRRELLEAVRTQIRAGRIGPDTPVLHVAGSFQQWVATPLGVFTGVTETDVTPDAEDSIHTVGGRLLHLEAFQAALASRAYAYVLLEPSAELPGGLAEQIAGAGYAPLFTNGQGTLYQLGSTLTAP